MHALYSCQDACSKPLLVCCCDTSVCGVMSCRLQRTHVLKKPPLCLFHSTDCGRVHATHEGVLILYTAHTLLCVNALGTCTQPITASTPSETHEKPGQYRVSVVVFRGCNFFVIFSSAQIFDFAVRACK